MKRQHHIRSNEQSIIRHRRPSIWLAAISGLSIIFSATAVAWACSVPVCRYALERWRADAYEVVVFHDGDLKETQSLLDRNFDPDETTGTRRANARLKLIHVKDDELSPLDAVLWKQHAEHQDDLPRMSVRYPDRKLNPRGIWHGKPDNDFLETMMDSPLRQDVAEELIKGTSAVWVLLEGGNKQADDAAAKTLREQLAHLEKTLEISKPDAQDISEGLINIDPSRLELSFRMFRLSREDVDEKFFVESLLNSEDDLQNEEFAGQPMAFPIFGRGRVLYALVGRGIAADNIKEACQFLSGPCSCQVKEQNPGVDLLMAVNWEALVNQSIPQPTELPPLAGLGGFVTDQKSPPAADDSADEESSAAASDVTTSANDSGSAAAEEAVETADEDSTESAAAVNGTNEPTERTETTATELPQESQSHSALSRIFSMRVIAIGLAVVMVILLGSVAIVRR